MYLSRYFTIKVYLEHISLSQKIPHPLSPRNCQGFSHLSSDKHLLTLAWKMAVFEGLSC